VSVKIWADTVREKANSDVQFQNTARQWSFDVLLKVGDDDFILEIKDGLIARFEPNGDRFQGCDAVLGGTDHDWQQLLELVPPPFYQDFFGAWFQHGFTIEGDLKGLFSHYWVFLRLLDLMREARRDESGAV
jgi:hypothetical protein